MPKPRTVRRTYCKVATASNCGPGGEGRTQTGRRDRTDCERPREGETETEKTGRGPVDREGQDRGEWDRPETGPRAGVPIRRGDDLGVWAGWALRVSGWRAKGERKGHRTAWKAIQPQPNPQPPPPPPPPLRAPGTCCRSGRLPLPRALRRLRRGPGWGSAPFLARSRERLLEPFSSSPGAQAREHEKLWVAKNSASKCGSPLGS